MKLIIALLPILLAACGGGGSSGITSKPLDQCRVTVQLIGDSTTAEQDDRMQRYVDSQVGKGVASVVNSGVGNTTVAQAPAPIPGAILVVGYGINDVRLTHEEFTARMLALKADIYTTPTHVTVLDNSAFAAMIRGIAPQVKAELVDVYAANIPLRDGVHPTPAGYEQLVSMTGPAVVRAVLSRCASN